MFRRFIAGSLTAAAVGIGGVTAAGVAHADSNTDTFLEVLHSHGIVNSDGDGMLIAAGELICLQLQDGHSPLRVAKELYMQSQLVEPASAMYFVGASIAAFCPAAVPAEVPSVSVV